MRGAEVFKSKKGCPDQPMIGVPKHQAVAEQPEQKCANKKIDYIFDGHIDAVFRSTKSGFKAAKPGLHQENQTGTGKYPNCVGG